MKILAVDIGTGTQDIFLYDSRLDIENGFKMVLPAPTMMVHRRIRQATRRREAVLLTGVMMGGGPSAWAAEDHIRAGLPLYATPDAARSFNDDLQRVEAMGVKLISEDEALPLAEKATHIITADFDIQAIFGVFSRFSVAVVVLAAVAVAVFDHGNAPPGMSDRKFRFDYLASRLRQKKNLSSFAFLSEDIPSEMTRFQAVARSAAGVNLPLVVMDTAPAAVLGASLDTVAGAQPRKMLVNLGNFHTLAFRLGEGGVEGLFEHHTGEVNLEKLQSMLIRLANGSLGNAEVFLDNGHGAQVYTPEPLLLGEGEFDVVVTGPRRSLFTRSAANLTLRPYFAVPFGDMMIAGCFGLLSAAADLLPDLAPVLHDALAGTAADRPPWEG